VVATSALKASAGFTRLGPSVVVAVGYCLAFFLLSLTLRTIPLGIALIAAGVVVMNLFSRWVAH
jgi:small multidrug resistance pump